MRIVNLKQNGKDWRTWRGKGIGASDAPAIMGESPWSTPLECWLEKKGLYKRPFNEFAVAAMRRGTELEPKARVYFERIVGESYPSCSAEHDEYPFIRSSFDGFSERANAILEIKCPGKEDHGKALKGFVPNKYRAQIQQQLLVSGAEKCYYVSWNGVDSGDVVGDQHMVIIEVFPDPEYQKDLLNALINFWDSLQANKMPPVTKEEAQKFSELAQKKQQEAIDAVNLLNCVLAGSVE